MNQAERHIKLDHVLFTEVECKSKIADPDVTHELGIQLGFMPTFSEEHKKEFGIVFDIGLSNRKKEFKLKIKAIAQFSTDLDIDEDFKISQMVEVNAPAIAFPYIRTFISNLTLNSGFNPVVLPSFNFVALSEERHNNASHLLPK